MTDSFRQPYEVKAPSITQENYHMISEEARKKLSTVLDEIRFPIENTSKISYEYITIFALKKKGANLSDSLKTTIKPLQLTKETDANVFELKWPWPENEKAGGKFTKEAEESTSSNVPKSIKVILHVWDSNDRFTEFMTQKAFRELSKLLGRIISRYGLTYKDDILYMRVPDLEKVRKSESCIKMMTGRTQILSYLGLDASKDLKAFKTWTELMDYATTCRFYDPVRLVEDANKVACQKAERRKSEAQKSGPKKTGTTKSGAMMSEVTENKDNQMDPNKLSMFKYFVQICLPAKAKSPAFGANADARLHREVVIKAAKASNSVDLEFAKSFENAETAVYEMRRYEMLDKSLRAALPKFVKGAELKSVLRGFHNRISLKGLILPNSAFGAQHYLEPYVDQLAMNPRYVESDVNWVYAGAMQRVLDAKKSGKHYKAYKQEVATKADLNETLAKEAAKLAKLENLEEREKCIKKITTISNELATLQLNRQKIKDATLKLKANKDWRERQGLEDGVDKAIDKLLSYFQYSKHSDPQPAEEVAVPKPT